MNKFILFAFLFLFSACAFGEDKPDPKALVAQVEKALAEAQKEAPLEPWIDSKTHFMLARGYAFLGDDAKSREQLRMIKHIRDRRILIRPFLDSIYAAARAGNEEKVVSIITTANDAARLMDAPAWADITDPEFSTTVGEKTPIDWLEESFCETAAYAWTYRKDLKRLIGLSRLAACKRVEFEILNLQISLLMREKKLLEAYEVALTKGDKTLEPVQYVAACKNDDGYGDQLDELSKSGKNAPLVLAFTEALGEYKRGYDFAITHPGILSDEKARPFLVGVYESLFKADEVELAIDLAEKMNLFEQAVVKKEHWSEQPRQWWTRTVDAGRILEDKPGADAIKIARKFKDARARFKILKGIFLTLEDDKVPYPDCDKRTRECIIDELAVIAEAEKVKYDRDVMNGILSELARITGDAARQQFFLDKIEDKNQLLCFHDVCSHGVVVKLTTKQERDRANAERELKRQEKTQEDGDPFVRKVKNMLNISYVPEFETAPTVHKELQNLLQEMHRAMNEDEYEFRLSSTQSGYHALGFTQAFWSRFGKTIPCPVDRLGKPK